ncbi:MAG TPA: T9SS type A sorting domain-containing protein, partial [Flavobacteriaceae bacterium]|nr:T9SS type A sorting domain-containing protein [Flavobacteriaceae bacterium]
GNAMELTPPSLSLTTIVDFATTDINIAISDETQTLNQVAFCNLGIAENNLASTGIEVYPNPTTGNLNIEAKGKIDQINLYDSMGRLIGKFDQASINIGKESAGYYFLEVVVDNQRYYKKVIKK